jgi:hypothetical protein
LGDSLFLTEEPNRIISRILERLLLKKEFVTDLNFIFFNNSFDIFSDFLTSFIPVGNTNE